MKARCQEQGRPHSVNTEVSHHNVDMTEHSVSLDSVKILKGVKGGHLHQSCKVLFVKPNKWDVPDSFGNNSCYIPQVRLLLVW